MNSKQVEILEKFLKVLANPPKVTLDEDCNLDEPVILIEGGFSIRDTNEVERKSIGGTRKLQGFALDVATYRSATRWEPEEHDYQELYADTCYTNVAAEAVRRIAGVHIDHMLDEDSWNALAKEQEEARQLDNNAYNEGHVAYKAGKEVRENPYPAGISVWYKWRQGWNDAEGEACTAEYNQKAGLT